MTEQFKFCKIASQCAIKLYPVLLVAIFHAYPFMQISVLQNN